MDTDRTLFDRLRAAVMANSVAIVVGLAVVLVAVVAGLMAGAVPIFVVLGIVLAVAAFAVIAWRQATRVGAVLGYFVLVGVVLFGVIQLVPYGRSHDNPPVIGEPAWATPQTRELMVNACFGCHSNEVEWPWYSNVAPVSWLVTRHVDEGRGKVNYSEFTADRGDAEETIEVIRDGEMPPSYYTLLGLHPEAKLTDQEIADLIAGLQLTPGMGEND